MRALLISVPVPFLLCLELHLLFVACCRVLLAVGWFPSVACYVSFVVLMFWWLMLVAWCVSVVVCWRSLHFVVAACVRAILFVSVVCCVRVNAAMSCCVLLFATECC